MGRRAFAGQGEEGLGYFGLPGSFAHEVSMRMAGTNRLVSFPQQPDAFAGLQKGMVARIVVPFENSVGGAVPETLDQLVLMKDWERHFSILEQWVFPVHLCLMGRMAKVAGIRRVYSHFVPLQVVGPWLRKEIPDVELVMVGSTSAAAEQAAKDPAGASVGNPAAAEVYGLKILARDLAPVRTNITRFLLIGLADQHPVWRRGQRRRAMIYLRVRNTPGALADALLVCKRFGLNLTQILSRPIQGKPGHHQFLLELDWTLEEPRAKSFWKALQKPSASLHLLGIYPVRSV